MEEQKRRRRSRVLVIAKLEKSPKPKIYDLFVIPFFSISKMAKREKRLTLYGVLQHFLFGERKDLATLQYIQ